MKKLGIAIIFGILAITTSAVMASQAAPLSLTPAPYRITVTPLIRQIKIRQEFPVVLHVTNSSPTPQSFVTFGCSWGGNWHIRSTEQRGGITFGSGNPQPCHWNPLQTIYLKPGESYQRQAIMTIWDDSKQHKINFQVGFTTSPEGKLEKGPVYWSDKVAVEIVK